MFEGISAKNCVDILIKHAITTKQLFLLIFLYLDRLQANGELITEGSEIANLYRFSHGVEAWTKKEVTDLVKKGLIQGPPAMDKDSAHPDQYFVTDLFVEEVFTTKTNFEEFWDAYPPFVDIIKDGQRTKIPLKASNYEDVERSYRVKVKTSWKHSKVMNILAWGKENNLVNMNIGKYVDSKMYDQHQSLKDSGDGEKITHTVI